MKKKSYKITFALKEGYSLKGTVHTVKYAEHTIKDWMMSRLEKDKDIVSGLLQEGKLFFPSVEEKKSVTVSSTAIFTGELSSPKDLLRKDREVKNTLESLAIYIKKKLKQESVFIIYKSKNWCV